MRRFRRLGLLALLTALALAPWGPARADHLESFIGPAEPRREFPEDFIPLLPVDAQHKTEFSQWQDPHVGGWGSDQCPADHFPLTPVIFVHGNTEDASFWKASESGDGTIVNVRQRFLDAGYCERELWAISYTGARGYTTYNDINTSELYDFVHAVRSYLDVGKVDVVAHSLGVTVVRKAMLNRNDLQHHISKFVAIAGANEGTTTCRGSGSAHVSHVCEEVEPGSAWLAELNSIGQTPKGPEYLTILDGTGVADHFYLGPDALSPELDGACNHHMPFVAHNTLARGAEAVQRYLAFLRDGALPACAGATEFDGWASAG